jgi:5'(3')-deoxyribonucleotidase
MKKLVIAVDCDDVLVGTFPVIIDDYNRRHGTYITLADAYSDDLNVWGVKSDDEAIHRVFQLWRDNGYEDLLPVHQAVEVLNELKQRHELHLITGRADFLQEGTRRWIEKNLPNIFASMEFTNYIVPTIETHISRSKLEVCKAIGADVLIDDHFHHAQQVAAGDVTVLLFGDYPWNRVEGSLPTGIVRVKDWQAVRRYFAEEHQ